MEEPEGSVRRQLSIVIYQEDYAALDQLARSKRSSIAQVVREFIVEGIERRQRPERAAEAVAV